MRNVIPFHVLGSDVVPSCRAKGCYWYWRSLWKHKENIRHDIILFVAMDIFKIIVNNIIVIKCRSTQAEGYNTLLPDMSELNNELQFHL